MNDLFFFLLLSALPFANGGRTRITTATRRWDRVVFDSPTKEPGLNVANQPIISGGMPLGNGDTTALVFPVVEGGGFSIGGIDVREGVHVWIGMAPTEGGLLCDADDAGQAIFPPQ